MRNDRESRLARAAGRQHGVVATDDVRSAGLDRYAVGRAVNRGLLHPMFPGAWSVGHKALNREAWWMAAILSVGDGALLTGPSACQLYGVYKKRIGQIHVLSANRSLKRGRLVVHRGSAPRRKRNGIPVVPIEEALLGLAASDVSDHDLRRAIRQAQVDKLTTYAKLAAHAKRSARRRGVTRLRLLLGAHASPTRSELEDAAVELLRRYGFEPQINVIVDGEEADLVVEGVIIELDSEEFHDNSITALDDARKHAHWRSRGRRTQSWTWNDLHVTPVRTIRRLQAPVASAA
jgi:hypothetical protein